MRVSLNLFSSIFFFTIYFVLVYKSKKSILLLDNVSRAELLQACVCDMQSVRVAKLFAHTHTCANTFLDYFELPTAWKSFPEWHIIFKLYIHNFLISVSIPMKAEYSNRNYPHNEWNYFIWVRTAKIRMNTVQISHFNCVKVRTFWETHKIWKNLPHDFDKSADLLSKLQNHEEDFFKLCLLLKKSVLWIINCISFTWNFMSVFRLFLNKIHVPI